jgi:hypothetical protein
MQAADLSDPRAWPAASPDDAFPADVHRMAEQAMRAPTRREADAIDAATRERLAAAIASRDAGALECTLAHAPSVAVARHVRRLLVEVERRATSEGVGTLLFALPVIVVAALDGRDSAVTLPGVLRDPAALATILREARAFGGPEHFGLAGALVGADAIDVAALPGLLARAAHVGRHSPLDLRPAPIVVRERAERVHLRFAVGALLRVGAADPFAEAAIARWGMPLAKALVRDLRIPGVTALALPRPPQRLLPAVQTGRVAQREVSFQLFASNAIRKLRASYGEPTATISAHRAADVPDGGELRVSLSSPFAPREAEGFRCPLYPYEAVSDVGEALQALLRDCRMSDVRFVAGVHNDLDPVTGGRLFFKDDAATPLH